MERNLVKQFYTSGLLFDTLNYFGDLSEDVIFISGCFEYFNFVNDDFETKCLVDSQKAICKKKGNVFE